MRMRNPKDKKEIINKCDFFYDKNYGFNNNNNIINLEIGMGKGDFILNMAINNPNINFIGVEKYSAVITYAIKKINSIKPQNLKILNIDAILLPEYLTKQIDTIYLNFSDPWPKKRTWKRRLTSSIFLKEYDKLFKDKAHIIMKTDNDDLFSYSLKTLTDYGYKIINKNYDLHNSGISNVVTEYEKKFSEKGFKIKYLEAIK